MTFGTFGGRDRRVIPNRLTLLMNAYHGNKWAHIEGHGGGAGGYSWSNESQNMKRFSNNFDSQKRMK